MANIATAQPVTKTSAEYEAAFKRLMAEVDATTEDLLLES